MSNYYQILLDGTDVCEIGLETCQLELRAGGPDRLSLRYSRVPSGTPPHAFDDTVTLSVRQYDGDDVLLATTTLFVGRIQPTSNIDRGGDEGFSYVALNGWDDLRKIIFTQSTKSYDPDTQTVGDVEIPRAILGQGTDGNLQTTGATITEILDHANGAGANVSAGTISPSIVAPPTEVVDTSCDQALRRYLRYHPDHVAWIEGTTMNVRPPSALSTTAVDPASAGVTWQYRQRDDRAPVGVVLHFEVTHTVDGETFLQRYTQSAGSTSGWPPPVRMTIPLEGVNITYQKQTIETRTIPDSESLNTTSAKEFYRGLVTELSGVDLDDILIADQSLDFVDPQVDGYDEDSDDVTTPNSKAIDRGDTTVEDLPRQLVSGSIEPWMGDGSLEAWEAVLTAKIRYTGTDPDLREKAGNYMEIREPITITNALPKTYKEIDEYKAPSVPISSDLATTYFNAISTAQNEGSISGFLGGEFLSLRPGNRVTITGVFSEAANVTSMSLDCLTQEFDSEFGASEYLTPKSLTELAQALNKNRPRWQTPKERTEARAPSGSKAIQNAGQPVRRIGGAGTQRRERKWDILVTDTTTPTVQIVNPGKVKKGWAVDSSDQVSIVDISASFNPSDGQYLTLRIEQDLTTTLVLESAWTGHPNPVESTTSDGVYVMYRFHAPLWYFVATASASSDSIKISDSLRAERLVPDSDFQIFEMASEDYQGKIINHWAPMPHFGFHS